MTGKTDWANRLQTIAFAHNVSHIPCLRTSPYALVFNRIPPSAVDMQVLEVARRSNMPGVSEMFLDNFQMLHEAITQNVLENTEVAEKHRFARAREHNLKEGV
jgi:hypothetical protein